jgi:type II pantothenate kinase
MAANNSGDAPIPLEEGVKHEAEPEAKGKAPANSTSTMLHRSGSRPQLDLSGAAIHGALEDRNPTILLPNQSDDISHLALDIGGTSAPACACLLSLTFAQPDILHQQCHHRLSVS